MNFANPSIWQDVNDVENFGFLSKPNCSVIEFYFINLFKTFIMYFFLFLRNKKNTFMRLTLFSLLFVAWQFLLVYVQGP